MKRFFVIFNILIACFFSHSIHADENRYQAHWNGKTYLIIDSDEGHLWTMRNDSMIYFGQVDGVEFIPPISAQVWQQNHGKWTNNN